MTNYPNRKFTGKPIDLTWKPGPWARNTDDDDDEDADDEPNAETETDSETDSDTETEQPMMEHELERQERIERLHLNADDTGETVAGTSPDDLHDAEIEFLPSDVNPGSMSTMSRQIVKMAATNPLSTPESIADQLGTTEHRVRSALESFYPDALDEYETDATVKTDGDGGETVDDSDVTEVVVDGETFTTTYDKPYRDPDLLRTLHHDKRMRHTEIADELGCSDGSIYNWLDRNDITSVSWGKGETLAEARGDEPDEPSKPDETADAGEQHEELDPGEVVDLSESSDTGEPSKPSEPAETAAVTEDVVAIEPATTTADDAAVPTEVVVTSEMDALEDVESFIDEMIGMIERERELAPSDSIESHAASKLTAYRTVKDYIQQTRDAEVAD